MTDKDTEIILSTINKNHSTVVSQLASLEDQVRHTNGRVKKLEKDKIERDAVDRYTSAHPTIKRADNVVLNKSVWNDPKLVAAIITALGAVTAFLIFNTGP
jgi:TolA-binding protein